VLLAAMPRLMADLVAEEIARQADMLVVGHLAEAAAAAAMTEGASIDVVVVGGSLPTLASLDPRAAIGRRSVPLLTIAACPDGASLYELRPLGSDITAPSLADAIRRVVRERVAPP
jgi:hypothetical protein